MQPPDTESESPVKDGISLHPTPIDETEAQTGVVSQELLDAVFDDLMERLGASREAIAIEEARAVVWRDGSLGCPQKGMMYTRALVPGYRIILQVSDETFGNRASEAGYFVLCEEGMAEEPLSSDAGGLGFDKQGS